MGIFGEILYNWAENRLSKNFNEYRNLPKDEIESRIGRGELGLEFGILIMASVDPERAIKLAHVNDCKKSDFKRFESFKNKNRSLYKTAIYLMERLDDNDE